MENINFKEKIREFISQVPRNCTFDTHSVIEFLIKNYTESYLEMHISGMSVELLNSKISSEIKKEEGFLVHQLPDKHYSKNIHGNYSVNVNWLRI